MSIVSYAIAGESTMARARARCETATKREPPMSPRSLSFVLTFVLTLPLLAVSPMARAQIHALASGAGGDQGRRSFNRK